MKLTQWTEPYTDEAAYLFPLLRFAAQAGIHELLDAETADGPLAGMCQCTSPFLDWRPALRRFVERVTQTPLRIEGFVYGVLDGVLRTSPYIPGHNDVDVAEDPVTSADRTDRAAPFEYLAECVERGFVSPETSVLPRANPIDPTDPVAVWIRRYGLTDFRSLEHLMMYAGGLGNGSGLPSPDQLADWVGRIIDYRAIQPDFGRVVQLMWEQATGSRVTDGAFTMPPRDALGRTPSHGTTVYWKTDAEYMVGVLTRTPAPVSPQVGDADRYQTLFDGWRDTAVGVVSPQRRIALSEVRQAPTATVHGVLYPSEAFTDLMDFDAFMHTRRTLRDLLAAPETGGPVPPSMPQERTTHPLDAATIQHRLTDVLTHPELDWLGAATWTEACAVNEVCAYGGFDVRVKTSLGWLALWTPAAEKAKPAMPPEETAPSPLADSPLSVTPRNARPTPSAPAAEATTYLSDWIEPHRHATDALLAALMEYPSSVDAKWALGDNGTHGPLYEVCRRVAPGIDWDAVLPVFFQHITKRPIQLHSCLVKQEQGYLYAKLYVPDAHVTVPDVFAARPGTPPVSQEPSAPSEEAKPLPALPSLAAVREQLSAHSRVTPRGPTVTKTLSSERHQITAHIWPRSGDDPVISGMINAMRRSESVAELMTDAQIASHYTRRQPLDHPFGGARDVLPTLQGALGAELIGGLAIPMGKTDSLTGWCKEVHWFAVTAEHFVHAIARIPSAREDAFTADEFWHEAPTTEPEPPPTTSSSTTAVPTPESVAVAERLGVVTPVTTQTGKQLGWRVTVRTWPASAFPSHQVFVAYNEYTSPFRAARPRRDLDAALPDELRPLDHPDVYDALEAVEAELSLRPKHGCAFTSTKGGTTTVRCHVDDGDAYLHVVATRASDATSTSTGGSAPQLPISSGLVKTAAIGAAVVVGGGVLTVLAFLLLW